MENHIHTSEKAANEFRDKLDGKWRIFKLKPVEVIEEVNEGDGEYYVEPIPDDEMFHGSNGW
ncbi:hypothetical protein ACWN8V_06970 [Vagococcus elongatus]|uniref:hypothetical protein n=1 Tax=Vagococcus elongatus TaxID=180344 RepID=UPI000F85D3F1|nr:hypothetical protein [Vagococcus elongatus]